MKTREKRRLLFSRLRSAIKTDIRLRLLFWSGALSAGFLFLLWPTFSAYIAWVHPHITKFSDDDIWADFERAAIRARGVAMLDSEERFVGVLNSSFETDHLGELGGRTQYSGFVLDPDHKSIPLADAPDFFWRCLVYHEDVRRGTWDNPYGVSFTGTLLIPFRMIAGSVRAGRPVRPAGGSTLEMQLARSIWKSYSHNSNPFVRKLSEWHVAPTLRRQLGGRHDSQRLRAWIVQHIALVQAVGDEQDVFGIEAAGRIIFGRSAHDLDPAEELVLSAMVRQPLRIRQDKADRASALQRHIGSEDNPGRALQCASPNAILADGEPVISDPAVRAAARARLLRLHTEELPFVDPDLEPYIAPLLAHSAGPRVGPQRIASWLVTYGVQSEIVASLADTLDTDWQQDRNPWRGQATEVALTLDMPRNLRLAQAMNGAVARLEDNAGRRGVLLPGTLTSPERWGKSLDPDAEATRTVPFLLEKNAGVPIMVAVADEQGRIIRLVNTGFDANYLGGAAQRRDVGNFGNGRYILDSEFRSVASIGKVAAALLIGESGGVSLRTPVSNRCPDGLTEKCMSPVSFTGGYPSVLIEKAFAESLNAATVNVLSAQVNTLRIEDFMARAGFNLPREDQRTPPATNVALGNYSARPHTVHTLMQMALAYAEGDFDAEITRPHLIERWRRFNPTTDTYLDEGLTDADAETVKLSDILAPGNGRFVREVLEAPLCYRDNDGLASLRQLRDWCASENPAVRLHIAKTGTVPAPEKNGFNESDWWLAGAIRFTDGRAYTYVVTAGSGDISVPFARDGGAGWLSEVVDTVLHDLETNK